MLSRLAKVSNRKASDRSDLIQISRVKEVTKKVQINIMNSRVIKQNGYYSYDF